MYVAWFCILPSFVDLVLFNKKNLTKFQQNILFWPSSWLIHLPKDLEG